MFIAERQTPSCAEWRLQAETTCNEGSEGQRGGFVCLRGSSEVPYLNQPAAGWTHAAPPLPDAVGGPCDVNVLTTLLADRLLPRVVSMIPSPLPVFAPC